MVKQRFELLEGKHRDGGKYYKKGDIIESDKDLSGAFPKRFRRLDSTDKFTPPTPPTPTTPITVTEIKKGDKSKVPDDAALVARGKDTTDKFPKVDGKLLRVFKRDEHYHIFEPDSVTPINGDPLNKNQVESFCLKFLEE